MGVDVALAGDGAEADGFLVGEVRVFGYVAKIRVKGTPIAGFCGRESVHRVVFGYARIDNVGNRRFKT